MQETKSTIPLAYDHVMIQHMGASRETRVLRKLSRGHRYKDITLDTGRRIRNKGDRLTEVKLQELAHNHQQILELMRVGKIKVLRPDEKVMSYDEVKGLVEHLGERLDLQGYQDEKEVAKLHREVMDPKTQAPEVEEPKVEEPKVEEPKAEEPKVEEPTEKQDITKENPALSAKLASEAEKTQEAPAPAEPTASPEVAPVEKKHHKKHQHKGHKE